MIIQKKVLAFGIFSLFLLYGLNPEYFEREFFLNELLSLIGFIVFLIKTTGNNRFSIPNSNLYKAVCILILLSTVNLVFSFFIKTNLYFYLRNAVIVYSIFSFFLGFYLYKYQSWYFKHIRLYLWVYLLPVVSLGIKSLLDRLTGAVFFPFLFSKFNRKVFTGLLLFNIIYAFTFDSLTVTLITILLFGIVVIRRYLYFKIAAATSIVFVLFITIWLSSSLILYKKGPYTLFGNIQAVIDDHYLLSLDDNSTWRLVLWYRVVVDNFPQNIIGIGMGTPLLHYERGIDSAVSTFNPNIPEHNDEHDIHVMGTHNTYLTLFIRLGLPYLLVALFIYHIVFREYYDWQQYYREHHLTLLFISFFTISIIGLFNLVLESPIGASSYWLLLGLVAGAVQERKKIYRSILLEEK